eukprot:SAG31_NODE_10872_length_1088_cov_1.939333_1_plen_181_part_00
MTRAAAACGNSCRIRTRIYGQLPSGGMLIARNAVVTPGASASTPRFEYSLHPDGAAAEKDHTTQSGTPQHWCWHVTAESALALDSCAMPAPAICVFTRTGVSKHGAPAPSASSSPFMPGAAAVRRSSITAHALAITGTVASTPAAELHHRIYICITCTARQAPPARSTFAGIIKYFYFKK